uniref:Uncharacterized protein n=1 Tax=Oryza punctata TaxID=4537 RepID=A0A0E0LHL7_ORYPU
MSCLHHGAVRPSAAPIGIPLPLLMLHCPPDSHSLVTIEHAPSATVLAYRHHRQHRMGAPTINIALFHL